MIISKNSWLIHVFAALHALVSFVCYATGIADDLMLTLLTMFMIVMLCLRRRVSMPFMAIAVILVNIVGFGVGMGLASLLSLISLPVTVVHPLSTLICTEILGWSTELCASRFGSRGPGAGDGRNLRWLLFAFVLIIIVRLILMFAVSGFQGPRTFMIEILLDYIFSCVIIVWVAEYAIRSREQAEKEAEKANLALFRYMKLKQQVNPHFLFNSLNVLDCLIQEQSPSEASRYTHKLAEIYRYMLRHEEETLVSLREEMVFVEDYVGLLKVRFPEGFVLEVDIPERFLSGRVVPCSVQLLIENAFKHNAVSVQSPLRISVVADETAVTVTNNICPKLSGTDSTGLGLKYLRRQYEDISGRAVKVESESGLYSVKLPLL